MKFTKLFVKRELNFLKKKKILAVVVRNNPTDLLINDISKAIEHWDHLKQENNE